MNFPHSWYLAHADVRTYNGVWTSSHVGDFVCVTSFAGDMKKHLVAITGLQLEEQRLLFRGKEKDDDEHLHTAGVKNLSKILLLENKTNKQRKVVEDVKVVEEVERSGELSKASAAIADVRSEVDKLADRVAALQVAVNGGTNVEDKEFVVSTELLMRQLLKLDSIDAEGEAKLQRKAEVSI
ncbi:BAG family molecular chaperone regulator 4-like [Cucumis melo]|uniref:BAG family molecular chaperone regulator 4-like n=1 Tax=Cucumis melo TaxID=3656 RepID=A0ABM3KDW2_CUCME|nr:BAG family molecular chaperone regulator 4-like [Cucumis melo]XP_050942146.1 BAG family molecular chaperone regulator 4-like [Cucumis melo]XP_050942172.1 BAG family molecular chaperone regulator 4-like [Cucumis melo]XP_050946490.1 BAG family molecular chaperone regulator 4-like [Cucumis melo]